VITFISRETVEDVPEVMSTASPPLNPGAFASIWYVPGGRPSIANAPCASDSVSLVMGP